MEESESQSLLEEFALECINSKAYPDAFHNFALYRCNSCKSSEFELTVEHHTGSEDWSFRGIIWGRCSKCGYLMRLFTFTGTHREPLSEKRQECDCGNKVFITGQCERIEGDHGIPGFFDEGVIAGRCTECRRNKAIVFTD